MEAVFFHLDMDAFYASVEQNDHPDLKGKPVIVGGNSPRSVVSACSYEARRYGVHSAMPMMSAKKRCPHAVICSVNMKRYSEVSKQVMEILSQFSPKMKQISIDEAFLDMTGTQKLFGDPVEVAKKIKQAVFDQIGLTISIGIGSNPYIAKLASDYQKPNGLYRVLGGTEVEFIDRFELKKLWGVGEKSNDRLVKKGLFYPKQIREKSTHWLEENLGKSFGQFIDKVCRGEDPGILSEKIQNRSISNEITLSKDTTDSEVIRSKLLELSHQVMFRLMQSNESGRTVSVKIKYSNFKSVTIQKTVSPPLQSGEELFQLALQLFNQKWNREESIRLIGVGVSSLSDSEKTPIPELFDCERDSKHSVEKAILKIINKGGSVKKASLLSPDTTKQNGEKP